MFDLVAANAFPDFFKKYFRKTTSKSPISERVIFLNIKILLRTLKREVIHTISISQNKRTFYSYLIKDGLNYAERYDILKLPNGS